MLKIIGIVFIAIGSFNLFQYNKTMKDNICVKGVLIDYTYSPTLRRSFPIFRYTIDGITYKEEYRGSYTSKKQVDELKNINIDQMPKATRNFMKKLKDANYVEYEIGKEYKLLVNKNNPKEYWIAEDGTNKGREYIWLGIGTIFLIISFISKIIKIIF